MYVSNRCLKHIYAHCNQNESLKYFTKYQKLQPLLTVVFYVLSPWVYVTQQSPQYIKNKTGAIYMVFLRATLDSPNFEAWMQWSSDECYKNHWLLIVLQDDWYNVTKLNVLKYRYWFYWHTQLYISVPKLYDDN